MSTIEAGITSKDVAGQARISVQYLKYSMGVDCQVAFHSKTYRAMHDGRCQREVRTHRTQDMLKPGHAPRTHLGHIGHT